MSLLIRENLDDIYCLELHMPEGSVHTHVYPVRGFGKHNSLASNEQVFPDSELQ